MKLHCQENLESLGILALKLNNYQFTKELKTLSGATIGQHYRHILELYQSLLIGLSRDEINYDSRVRDIALETDVKNALELLSKIKFGINNISNNRVLTLKGNYACEKDGEINIITSIYRELAYNLEHSIHHQALIKVGLMELGCENYIDDNFGVAPSTIRFRNQIKIES